MRSTGWRKMWSTSMRLWPCNRTTRAYPVCMKGGGVGGGGEWHHDERGRLSRHGIKVIREYEAVDYLTVDKHKLLQNPGEHPAQCEICV